MQATIEQRQKVFEKLGYEPSKEQQAVHLSDLFEEIREKWVSGGEQGGKSLCSAREVMSRCLIEGPLWWLAGADYGNARREFEFCVEDAERLSLVFDKKRDISFPQQGQCSLKLLGGEVVIKTISLKDLHHVGQESPNGIVICEAAQVDWDAVMRCRTRVSAARGWVLLSGTLEGSLGWYAQKINEYQASNPEMARVFFIPSWANLFKYPGGREDEQIKYYENTLPEDFFNERFGATPCPPSHIILREFSTENVGVYPFKAELPVEITVDPGGAFKSGAYAVLAIQEWAGNVYVVDEVYLRGYVSEEIISPIVVNKPWWKNVKGGTIDFAAKQHHTTGLKELPSDIEIWYKKTGLWLRAVRVEEASGIERLRSFLKIDPVTKKPYLFVNNVCKGFISEAGGGKSPLDGGGPWLRDKNTGRPLDRNNHSAKAMYYWLVDKYGYVSARRAALGIYHNSPFE